jgi:Fic family protein
MLFQTPPVTEREAEVIAEIEAIRGQFNFPKLREWPGLPWRAIHAQVLRASTSLAGCNVLSEDAIAAAGEDEPGTASSEAWLAASSYRAALTFVLQLADAPDFTYDEGIFRALHYMMMGHDPGKTPGRWRRDSVSVRRNPSGDFLYRRDPSGEALYSAPHAKFIPTLMAELIGSLNGRDDFPVIIRAAMAHLNLTTIHPFVDGNGRMARALQTLVLARHGISMPAFVSIDEYLSMNSMRYEKTLQEVHGGAWQPERDARPWIRFCLTAHLRQATTLLRLTQEYDRLWDELEREVARHGLPERAIYALADAAIGGRLGNPEYRSAAGVSVQVANRDLKRLVDTGLLVATSDKRGRCYISADPVKAIRAQTRDPGTPDRDPFATS